MGDHWFIPISMARNVWFELRIRYDFSWFETALEYGKPRFLMIDSEHEKYLKSLLEPLTGLV